MQDSVSEQETDDMLWPRETRQVGSGKTYNPPAVPGLNTVLVERKLGFAGLDIAIYTKIAANINPTPELLAELAIRSAEGEAGESGKDGISYLISAKHYGIITPLMADYEKAILQRTNAATLEEALTIIRNDVNPNV